MTEEKRVLFVSEVSLMINKMSLESLSDTPDYIIAEYLADCLDAYSKAVELRDKWVSPGLCKPKVNPQS